MPQAVDVCGVGARLMSQRVFRPGGYNGPRSGWEARVPTSIPSDLTQTNIDSVLQILAQTHPKLLRQSRGLSAGQLLWPLGPGQRSLTQDLAHMLNSEARHAEAIYLALLDREPVFNNLHSERRYGKLVRLDLLSFAELLPYFRVRRQVLLHVLESLSVKQWARCIRETGKQRKESVFWRARSLAAHEQEHTSDIDRKLSLLGLGHV
jgi:hypothetical protein